MAVGPAGIAIGAARVGRTGAFRQGAKVIEKQGIHPFRRKLPY